MDEDFEFFGAIIILISSLILSVLFLVKWYRPLIKAWPKERGKFNRSIMNILPILAIGIILTVLLIWAAQDVINDAFYIIMYLFWGLAWVYICMLLVSLFFDISWRDDVLNNNNKGALMAVSGSFLGITAIYSGANIGDGPGWWCVLIAGGMGVISWFVLGLIAIAATNAKERITSGRDTGCGVRLGLYLLAIGIILGRASAGDWISFDMTFKEFSAGWPALALTTLFILVERLYLFQEKNDIEKVGRDYRNKSVPHGSNIMISVFWGVLFVALAVAAVLFAPVPVGSPLFPLS
ncbi:MAG: hypothetical protein FWE84_06085 [Firmicutes bacterium]|nr:hypothetical protein [Bacillota bacterium]